MDSANLPNTCAGADAAGRLPAGARQRYGCRRGSISGCWTKAPPDGKPTHAAAAARVGSRCTRPDGRALVRPHGRRGRGCRRASIRAARGSVDWAQRSLAADWAQCSLAADRARRSLAAAFRTAHAAVSSAAELCHTQSDATWRRGHGHGSARGHTGRRHRT
eukprot:330362-Chlamydomonas_euryale.AAC.2